ncbi:hypothetical protein F4778DRAFT_745634 [Xylariomycetidae sp. FL2044]|nr:hypothetical protein F4778DRAFT_745634 [Xylariomycetidae sp. FL2044]
MRATKRQVMILTPLDTYLSSTYSPLLRQVRSEIVQVHERKRSVGRGSAFRPRPALLLLLMFVRLFLFPARLLRGGFLGLPRVALRAYLVGDGEIAGLVVDGVGDQRPAVVLAVIPQPELDGHAHLDGHLLEVALVAALGVVEYVGFAHLCLCSIGRIKRRDMVYAYVGM